MTTKRKIVSGVLYAAIALIVAALIVGTAIATSYASIISIYLNQQTSKIVTLDEDGQDTAYFKSAFDSKKDLLAVQTEFAQTLQAEGSVLLKNTDNVLPLKANAKVTLLGQRSVDFLSSGGGSGAIDTKGMPTLKEAFTQAGYTVNAAVWDFYNTGAAKSYRGSASKVGEAPVSLFGDTEKDSFASFNDAAIVVIGRAGTESSDLSRTSNGDGDAGKHILEFSVNEIELITLAVAQFGAGKVVVLLNTMNVMELGPIDDLGVKACIWVGAGGQKGIIAVPKILNGTMYPSGRLVDTYAYDALDTPAMQNFGTVRFTNDNSSSVMFYAEGIYVGYKYYETRYEDKVLGAGSAGDFNYADEVQYPFGYGLSYTKFDYSGYSLSARSTDFEISVTVKNSGSAKGKEVVAIYMQSPYTAYDKTNGIEKAAVQLVGFAKTKELAAGASETVKITVPKESMRAYDANGYKTYIVDEGTYYFAAGGNAHDALNNILAAKGKNTAEGTDYDGNAALVKTFNQSALDHTTYAETEDGAAITNQLENADLKYYGATVTYLTRNDWTGTYPTAVSVERTDQMATDSDITTYFKDDPDAVMPLTSTDSEEYGKLTLASLIDAEFEENQYWDALLDRMTAEELYTLVRMGGYSTAAIESIAKPSTIDKDGPAGISSTLVGGVGCFGYPIATVIACTYNLDLVETMGEYVGEDGIYSATHGWYSPAMNIHRSPFSGRNFEYYSEDGFVSGKVGAATVKGVQRKGEYAYIKHFAFNEQETGRSGLYTFGGEQALREIYLTPFELSVREGGALAMMASMNRAGCYWTGAHKGLMTEILRNEWGFKG
ncbi:MAG: glycoside hydrolase family 3 C-terminal domain-containing protein, partial [Clostridiales bacterium]|nr:glycoside hydrolase family 3 C-terminal domain-containing protein [Clostridiales bacterium]